MEGGAYRVGGHTLLGLAAGGKDGGAGALASAALMPKVESLMHEMNLPEGLRQGLETAVAGSLGIAAGDTKGGATAVTLDLNNRQLHSFEQSLADELAEGSEYTPEQIADALRAMYNDELGEAPGDNRVVNFEQDRDAVETDYFDYGGEWLMGDGAMVQNITSPSSSLIGYIIEQTGGDSSPYRAIESLPPDQSTALDRRGPRKRSTNHIFSS